MAMTFKAMAYVIAYAMTPDKLAATGTTIRRYLLPRYAAARPAVGGRLEQGDAVVEVR